MVADTVCRYPRTLALVGNDVEQRRALVRHIEQADVVVQAYDCADSLLCSARPFAYDFYVICPPLRGVDGLSLLRMLRKRTGSGALVLSAAHHCDEFAAVIDAGADMHLTTPVEPGHVLKAIGAVYRRSAAPAAAEPAWRLDAEQRHLVAPDGKRVELSRTDLHVLGCLLEAAGCPVSGAALVQRIGLAAGQDRNLLHATIYRLRRRIERATAAPAPLQSRSRLGYVFGARLMRA